MEDYGALKFLMAGAALILFAVVTLAPLKLFSIHRELQRQTELLERIAESLDGSGEV